MKLPSAWTVPEIGVALPVPPSVSSAEIQPPRLRTLLTELLHSNENRTKQLVEQGKELRKELRGVEEKPGRLYEALAEGTVERTDAFRNTVSRYEQRREELLRLVSSADRKRQVPAHLLNPKNIEHFAAAMRQAMRDRESGFRKAYLRHFVDRVDVSDEEIRIRGSHAALVSGLEKGTEMQAGGVPSFGQDWWAHQGSNLGPAD